LGSYPADGDLALRVQRLCFQKKMIIERGGRHGATLRILCALIITKAEVEEALRIFTEVVKEAEAEKTATQ